jgi:hypothetical protein
MGSLLAVPANCLATLAGSFAATCCFKAMGLGNAGSKSMAKILYFVLQLWVLLLTYLARDLNGRAVYQHIPGLNACESEAPGGKVEGCYGDQLAYRVNLAAVLVFLCSMPASVSSSYFVGKFTAVVALPLFFTLVPNTFFSGWAAFNSYLTVPFILTQILVVIDFGYTWNETWVGLAAEEARANIWNDNAGRRWYIALVASSAALLAFAAIGDVMLFVEYPGSAHRWLVSLVLLGAIASTVVSITEWAAHGSLLPSALVAAFSTLLLIMALDRDEVCLSVTIAYVTLAVHAGDPKESPDLFHKDEPQAQDAAVSVASGDARDLSGPPVPPLSLIQNALGAAYVGLAMSQWDAAPEAKFSQHAIGAGLLLTLYMWTLCAPQLFPNREF